MRPLFLFFPVLLIIATLAPSAEAQTPAIQRGSTLFTSSTLTIPIEPVDPQKSILIFNVAERANTPNTGAVACALEETSIDCTRPTAGYSTIHYQVLEYPSGVSVQRGTARWGSENNRETIALEPVDPTQSFVLLNGFHKEGSSWSDDDFVSATLGSDTLTLRLRTKPDRAGNFVSWQVIEMEGASVQRGTLEMPSSNTSALAALPPVDLQRTLLLFSYTAERGSASLIGQKLIDAQFTDQLTATRSLPGAEVRIEYQLVTLPEPARVTAHTILFNDTQTRATLPLSADAVLSGNNALLGNGVGQSNMSRDDNPGAASFTTALNDALTVTRGTSGSTAQVTLYTISYAQSNTTRNISVSNTTDHNITNASAASTNTSNTSGRDASNASLPNTTHSNVSNTTVNHTLSNTSASNDSPSNTSMPTPPTNTTNVTNEISPPTDVAQWGIFEQSIKNTRSYANPYDVELTTTFTRPDNTKINFWGFYDGDNTWKFRVMCDQIGEWHYTASFSDGSGSTQGTFTCTPSNIPGKITTDETNPLWFGYEGGNHELIRSFHVGDKFFASNWDDPRNENDGNRRAQFLDWAQAQGYNTLSIASHYFNRDAGGRGSGWDTPELWSGENPNAREYQELEVMLDDLSDRGIIVYPSAGFFGRDSNYPTNSEGQEQYIRYTLARLAPYWNVMLNVGGPEPDHNTYLTDTQIKQLGSTIASHDVFSHPLSVHLSQGANEFNDEPWLTYVTYQGAQSTDPARVSSELLSKRHPEKPLFAQETLWPGNRNQPSYSEDAIRQNAYIISMSAAALNFGDMDGDSSSGFTGSFDLADRNQVAHDIVKEVWDFFETVPFYRMAPCQNLVNRGYCLGEEGREYLVYFDTPGSTEIELTDHAYEIEWINTHDTTNRRPGGTARGRSSLTPPGGEWIAHVTRSDE